MATQTTYKPALAQATTWERVNRTAVKAGDRTRDAVTGYLALAYAEGHLTAEEFESRMGRALTARTEDYLDFLLCDLPSSITQPLAVPAVRRSVDWEAWGWGAALAALVCLLGVLIYGLVLCFSSVSPSYQPVPQNY